MGLGRFWMYKNAKLKLSVSRLKTTIDGLPMRIDIFPVGVLGIYTDNNNVYRVYVHNISVNVLELERIEPKKITDIFYVKDGDKRIGDNFITFAAELGIATHTQMIAIQSNKNGAEYGKNREIYLAYLPLKRFRTDVQIVKDFYLRSIHAL